MLGEREKRQKQVAWICFIAVSFPGVYGLNLLPLDYDPHLQPRGEDGGPVRVALSMRINSIYQVNERDMSVVMEVFFRASWRDPRLLIPDRLFNKSNVIPVSMKLVSDLNLWLPDPSLEQTEKISTVSLLQPFGGVRLHEDGRLLWAQMFIITLRCAMFYHDFPFDEQNCNLKMTSYFYGSEDMSFDWQDDGISASPDINKLLPNYEFTFLKDNTTSCFDEDYVNNRYPCLKSSMKFKRRYRNHLIGVYFPSLLFVLVAWASFFWPADAIPARTVLLITCLLTTISLYTGVQQITPPANYTRAIDIWFFACIVAVASALFEYAVILQLRKIHVGSSSTAKVSPVSDLILFIQPRSGERTYPDEDDAMIDNNRTRPDTTQRISKTQDATSREVKEDPTPKSSRQGSSNERHDIYWQRAEIRTELGAKICYMVAFVIFNIAYWCIYLL